jgi:hypothetical protein
MLLALMVNWLTIGAAAQPTVPHQLTGLSNEKMEAGNDDGEFQIRVCGLVPETVLVKFDPT